MENAAPKTRKAKRRKPVAAEQQALAEVSRLMGPAKVLGGLIVGTAAVVLAWNQLGLWKPASTEYVDGKVAIVTHKIDQVDTSTLQNRVETLSAAKARDVGEQSDLQLKMKLARDADYQRMIQIRAATLADQIQSLTNQINGLQTTIAGKNAPAK